MDEFYFHIQVWGIIITNGHKHLFWGPDTKTNSLDEAERVFNQYREQFPNSMVKLKKCFEPIVIRSYEPQNG